MTFSASDKTSTAVRNLFSDIRASSLSGTPLSCSLFKESASISTSLEGLYYVLREQEKTNINDNVLSMVSYFCEVSTIFFTSGFEVERSVFAWISDSLRALTLP